MTAKNDDQITEKTLAKKELSTNDNAMPVNALCRGGGRDRLSDAKS